MMCVGKVGSLVVAENCRGLPWWWNAVAAGVVKMKFAKNALGSKELKTENSISRETDLVDLVVRARS